MFKEAVIWAALLCGVYFSIMLFVSVQTKDKKNVFDLLQFLIGIFGTCFCGIYFIFRFFSWLAHLPIV